MAFEYDVDIFVMKEFIFFNVAGVVKSGMNYMS